MVACRDKWERLREFLGMSERISTKNYTVHARRLGRVVCAALQHLIALSIATIVQR